MFFFFSFRFLLLVKVNAICTNWQRELFFFTAAKQFRTTYTRNSRDDKRKEVFIYTINAGNHCHKYIRHTAYIRRTSVRRYYVFKLMNEQMFSLQLLKIISKLKWKSTKNRNHNKIEIKFARKNESETTEELNPVYMEKRIKLGKKNCKRNADQQKKKKKSERIESEN